MRRPHRRVARPCRSRRGGYALVFLGLFLIGILAIATLVVDVALARVTQDQMQTAAEASVLAGLRINTGASAANDIAAHTSASFFASLAFADNSGETSTGEGPLIPAAQTPGMPSPTLYAGETLDIRSAGPYNATSNPPLQPLALNEPGNLKNGDIVSGIYAYDATTPLRDLESPVDYSRTDFAAGSPPSTALLVRLRRVNSLFGTKNPLDNVNGVSTSGPALNFLFGHGTFIHGTSDNATYSPMRDGLAVRATSIASLRPATAVGWPATNGATTTPGSAPFALTLAEWDVLAASAPGSYTVALDGTQGIFFDPSPAPFPPTIAPDGLRVPAVGGRIAQQAAPPPPAALPFNAYVPLYDTVSGSFVIVGFVYVTVTDQTTTTATILTPVVDRIGENVSASVYDGIQASAAAGLSPATIEAAIKAAFDGTPSLLQAPALVR